MTAFLLLAIVFAVSEATTCTHNGRVAQGCQTVITNPEEFVSLAWANQKTFTLPAVAPIRTLVGPGAKILYDFRQPTVNRTRTWFIDTALYPSHSNFIQAIGEWDNYQSTSSQWFRCDWQSYITPDNKWFFGITINIGFPVNGDTIMHLCKNSQGMDLRFKHRCGWVSTDPINQKFNQTVVDYCKKLGFEVINIDDLFGASIPQFSPLHTGEAYGYLRVHPKPTDLLTPKDIVVFDFLPLDLSVVQGTVTSVYQTTNSHINLKSNERNTPNMILLNFKTYPCFAALVGKPVRLQVSYDGWGIEPSTIAMVDAWYTQKVSAINWLRLSHGLESDVRSFDQMCPLNDPGACLELKDTYGTKAASLGFLRNPLVIGQKDQKGSLSNKFGYDTTPTGFGIPAQLYIDFLNFPSNLPIKEAIARLNVDEMSREVPSDVRLNASNTIKKMFWNAKVPPAAYNAILQKCYEVFWPKGITKIKLRSSSNAEDLPGFNGAGLYDSFPAQYQETGEDSSSCIYDAAGDAMIPDTLECAIKGVYGSLFNLRAIEERTAARFIQDTVAMSIAVNPRYTEYGTVVANAVSISKNLEPAKPLDTAAYTFSVQTGDNDVTNPDPGTVAESSMQIWSGPPVVGVFDVLRYAVPISGAGPLTGPVLPPKTISEMVTIARQAEWAYCMYHWKLKKEICDLAPIYTSKLGLDMEFKYIALDEDPSIVQTLTKQLRVFSGQGGSRIVINVTGGCKWVSPIFYAPAEAKGLINVASNKIATSSGVFRSGAPGKAIDGEALDLYSAVLVAPSAAGNFWAIDLERDYVLETVRIFMMTPVATYRAQMDSFTVVLLDKSKRVIKSFVVSGFGSQSVIELTKVNLGTVAVRHFRIEAVSKATPSLAFTEVQMWALPFSVGNPGDFPIDKRPTPTAACVWGNWVDWSPCSVTCGTGVSNRTRGPLSCAIYTTDAYKEERTCGNNACAAPCVGYWSVWSPCTCSSSRSRVFSIIVPATGGGSCPATHHKEEVQNCTKPYNCPIDCVGRWSDFTTCDCDTKLQSRLFEMQVRGMYGGVRCPESPFVQSCEPQGCVVVPPPVTPAYDQTMRWVYKQGVALPTYDDLFKQISDIVGPEVAVVLTIANNQATVTLTSLSPQITHDAASRVAEAMRADDSIDQDEGFEEEVIQPEAMAESTNVGLVVGVTIACFLGVLLVGAIIIFVAFG